MTRRSYFLPRLICLVSLFVSIAYALAPHITLAASQQSPASQASAVISIKPKIVSSFAGPGNGATGLAWGNGSLWLTDADARLYRLDENGAILDSFTMTTTVSDLAWYEGNLWAHGPWQDVYRLDATGQVTQTLAIGYWAYGGLEWADGALYLSDYNAGDIHKFDRDGKHLASWETSFFGHPTGITYDGKGLWIGNSCEGENVLQRYSLLGKVQAVIDLDAIGISCNISSQEERALAWDGKYLWYSANNLATVYKLDISGLFEASGVSLAQVSGGTAAWGDYDNDGDLDILLSGLLNSTPVSKIYRNDGSNTFTDINAGLSGVYDGSAIWGDYDNDGDLDILLTGCGSSDCTAWLTRIYRNNGNSSFTNLGVALPALSSSVGAWGDYDNDGDLDIVLAGWKGGGSGLDNPAWTTQIMRNDGNGVFLALTGLASMYNAATAWGDYDNDGDLDLVIAGCRDYTCSLFTQTILYQSDGVDTFTSQADFSPIRNGSVAWGDYDSDGDLDLLLAGTTGWAAAETDISKVYRNDGGNSFTDINAPLVGVSDGTVAWGDYDNDGDLDILQTGSSTKVYRNDGNGDFTDLEEPLPPVISGAAVWGDYDNDGDLDILLVGVGSATVYRNTTLNANSVPSVPSGLSATVDGTSVTLNWNAATDTNTPSSALTYNLRIGTTPGGTEVAVPIALDSGYRQLPRLGNINPSRSWTIKNLAPRTHYYWSVQAIDTSLAGSPFAAEASFTTGENPKHETTTKLFFPLIQATVGTE